MTKEKVHQVTLRLSKANKNAIKRIAAKYKRSVNEQMAYMIEETEAKEFPNPFKK